MKIKLSKNQWKAIGLKTGWSKTAQLFKRFETFQIGPTPSDENCAQVGSPNYNDLNMIEVAVFKNQCKRQFPNIPNGAYYIRTRNEHEFGTYHELGIKFEEDNEFEEDGGEASNYAYNVENNVPEHWDEIAKSELQQKGYFQLLEQDKAKTDSNPTEPSQPEEKSFWDNLGT